MTISATLVHTGFIDDFAGHCPSDNQMLLYAHYDHKTTYDDLINEWIDAFESGGSLSPSGQPINRAEDFTQRVRDALLDMLDPDDRLSDVAWCAEEFGFATGLKSYMDSDDIGENPVAIVLLETE